MRSTPAIAIASILLVGACARSIGPTSPGTTASSATLPASAPQTISPVPSAVITPPPTLGPLPSPWSMGQSSLDYPGGPSEYVAEILNLPAVDVAARALVFTRPSGGGLMSLVFRVQGLTSTDAISRLEMVEATCGVPVRLSLAGLPVVRVRAQGTETCYEDYLIRLDAGAVAWFIDDGGFKGVPGPGDTPTPIRFLATSDVEPLVRWLHEGLGGLVLDEPEPRPTESATT